MVKLLVAGAACLSLAACQELPVEREEFQKTIPLAGDGSFRLENVNGRVDLDTWDQPQVDLHAVKKAHRPQDIEIRVSSSPRSVEVRTVDTRSSRLLFGSRSSVDYTIHVPKGVRLDLDDVNGTAEIKDPSGRVSVSTVNGRIVVQDARGEVRATTTNGTVKVTCSRVDPQGDYDLTTTNGKVEVVVPGNVNARFEGRTVNGWIETDLPLAVSGQLLNRRLNGQLGEGGASFKLSTVNGSLAVRKSPS
jgi:DUF4097 and DUF4098 domain-containing protein YvlB